MEFLEKFRSLGQNVKLRATGAISGHVLTAEPANTSEDNKSEFSELLALLAAGVTLGAFWVFRSIVTGSSSQLLGVTSAEPMRQAGAGIALGGFCLQASAETPQHDEEFAATDADQVPVARINSFLNASEKSLNSIVGEYYFVEKLGEKPFRQRFKQAGVWIITDNIGFVSVRDLIFPEYLFFTSGPMEVLFWLRESLKNAGEQLGSTRFSRELMNVLRVNHEVGFITEDQYLDWQQQFGFTIDVGDANA